MEDPIVVAAIIAAGISVLTCLIGGVITHSLGRKQLALRERELSITREELLNAIENLRQSQLSQVLSKRVEVYPELWKVIIQFETNWTIEKKKKDGQWALDYLTALSSFNLNHGVFISQDLYGMFGRLRKKLISVCDSTTSEEIVPVSHQAEIRSIVYGVDGQAGLSTFMKDDLGSYRGAFLQRRQEKNG